MGLLIRFSRGELQLINDLIVIKECIRWVLN